jgi:hypothetical protein
VTKTETVQGVAMAITFEPWLAGDRQIEKRVAKAPSALQRGFFEVSLS